MTRYLRLISVTAACAYFWYYARTYQEWHFIDGVNLIFHEAGHSIFFFLGEFIQTLAGSGLQILLPFFIALYFFYKKQIVSGAVCLLWTGQNLLNVSLYAADAAEMQMDLLGGDSVIHDWNYLLNSLGVLSHTAFIASGIYALGIITLLTGTILCVYYAWYDEKELYSLK